MDAHYLKFQFPLHRDPRCNLDIQTFRPDSISFSSLYIGILAATSGPNTLINMPFCFSSLYIGILAATGSESSRWCATSRVSVPFTSGSSLQQVTGPPGVLLRDVSVPFTSGSSLQRRGCGGVRKRRWLFQFPLHRDPRCNYIRRRCRCPCLQFQFPLHRDPRCNAGKGGTGCGGYCVSVPFTSGSSLQPRSHGRSSSFASVSVPFTSGSSLQPAGMSFQTAVR